MNLPTAGVSEVKSREVPQQIQGEPIALAREARFSEKIVAMLVNGVLSSKFLSNIAKSLARRKIIKRADSFGVDWPGEVEKLRSRNWDDDFAQVCNSALEYPGYYGQSYHGYDRGNLCWEAAFEQELAAYAVSYRTFPGYPGVKGDGKLRQNYHDILQAQITEDPKEILDLGCGVGLSTFALQATYPQAQVTGLDLSPYFLAVARHRAKQQQLDFNWLHAAAEATPLRDRSFDLVSASLIVHEFPPQVLQRVLGEAFRLLRPNGHLAIMDINPNAEHYAKMPLYVRTLFKSTEPWLDEYFVFNLEEALRQAGFAEPVVTPTSPRHRTVVAQRPASSLAS